MAECWPETSISRRSFQFSAARRRPRARRGAVWQSRRGIFGGRSCVCHGLVSRSVIGFLSPAALAHILAQLNRKIRPTERERERSSLFRVRLIPAQARNANDRTRFLSNLIIFGLHDKFTARAVSILEFARKTERILDFIFDSTSSNFEYIAHFSRRKTPQSFPLKYNSNIIDDCLSPTPF